MTWSFDIRTARTEVTSRTGADGHEVRTHQSLTLHGFAVLCRALEARGFDLDEECKSSEVGATGYTISGVSCGRIAAEVDAAVRAGDLDGSWSAFARFLDDARTHDDGVSVY